MFRILLSFSILFSVEKFFCGCMLSYESQFQLYINPLSTKDDNCRLRRWRKTTIVVFITCLKKQAITQKRFVLEPNVLKKRKEREILR